MNRIKQITLGIMYLVAAVSILIWAENGGLIIVPASLGFIALFWIGFNHIILSVGE